MIVSIGVAVTQQGGFGGSEPPSGLTGPHQSTAASAPEDPWTLGSPSTHQQDLPGPSPANGWDSFSPPYGWLAVASVALLVSAGLLLLARSNPGAAFVSWLLAGPVAIISGGKFLGEDARRRARATIYAAGPWTRYAFAVVAVAGVVLAVLSTFAFADWLARQ